MEPRDQKPEINWFRALWQVIFGLVIVTAIGLLLFPSLTQSPGRSLMSACMSNNKQLALSTLIYSSDWDDAVPHYYTFDGKTESFITVTNPYNKRADLYLCYEEKKNGASSGTWQEGLWGKMDYVHNLSLRGNIPRYEVGKRVLLTTCPNPEKIAYLRDPIRGFGGDNKKTGVGFLSPHGLEFNTSYLDGHTKRVKPLGDSSEL